MEGVTIQDQIKNSESMGGMERYKSVPGKFNNAEIKDFLRSLPNHACVVENEQIKSDFESTRDAQMYARRNNLLFAELEEGFHLYIRKF